MRLIKSYFHLFKFIEKRNNKKITELLKRLRLQLNESLQDKPVRLNINNNDELIEYDTIDNFKTKIKARLVKIRQGLIKRKRKSFKKIFISKAELKHTNSKINFILYIYNAEERSLLKKLTTKRINPLLTNTFNNFQNKITTINTVGTDLLFDKLEFISKLTLENLK